jgi:hypothetical protein
MADTLRTESYLLASLFQDGQAANSITPQDMRDLIVSIRPGFGECSMQSNATATTISSSGTYYKVAGTTALSGNEYLIGDGSASNRLKYTGTPTRLALINATIVFQAASNNKNISFKLYLYDDSGASGAVIDESFITHSYDGSLHTMHIQGSAMMATNDYIEIHVANNTDTANVTVTDINFRLLTLFS